MNENNGISELFKSVADNDFDTFLTLAQDIPKLVSERSVTGESVLHRCIEEQRKEFFDYLLAIEEFDVNVKDNDGSSSLHVAVIFTEGDPYYVEELLARGADPNIYTIMNETPLHWAVEHQECLEIARLLIEHGADINACCGFDSTSSVLVQALGNERSDMIDMLLYYNVDVLSPYMYNPFEVSVVSLRNDLQELLFPYTFDRLEPVDLELIVKMIQFCDPTFIPRVFKAIDSVVYDLDDLCSFYQVFHYIYKDHDLFKLFLQKFKNVFMDLVLNFDVLHKILLSINRYNSTADDDADLSQSDQMQNLRLLFDSGFVQALVENFRFDQSVFEYLCDFPDDLLEEVGAIFLSYGLKVTTEELFFAYKHDQPHFKNKLFRLMLHMKIEDLDYFDLNFEPAYRIVSIVPALIFDPYLTIEKFMALPKLTFTDSCIHYLLNYSALPGIKQRFLRNELDVDMILENSPDVPSLLELARNASRKLLIERFHVTKSYEYLYVVNKLDIPRVCKDILCFYRKLYDVTSLE